MDHLDADGIRLLSTVATAVFLPFTGIAISLNRRSRIVDAGRQFAIFVAICVSSASLFVMLLSWGGLTCDFVPSACQ
jgi:hypothetical protein